MKKVTVLFSREMKTRYSDIHLSKMKKSILNDMKKGGKFKSDDLMYQINVHIRGLYYPAIVINNSIVWVFVSAEKDIKTQILEIIN